MMFTRQFISCFLLFVILIICRASHAELQINELMAQNGTYKNGQAYEWVELYNNGASSIDLSKGYYLEYNRNSISRQYRFERKAIVEPKQYIVVYFVGEKGKLNYGSYCAPFEISAKGGTIKVLKNEQVVDQLIYPAQYGNTTYGRIDDGCTWQFLTEATPMKMNTSDGGSYKAEAPAFSISGGFYSNGLKLELISVPGSEIRYTTNGETPTKKSSLYTEAITVSKTTVIKARTFLPDAVPSDTLTETYFIEKPYNVAVVSLSTDNKYLFSAEAGLFVAGDSKDPNYYKNWEYPINFQFYTVEGIQEINQTVTFKIVGDSSKARAQKSIALYARKALGKSTLCFNPFENRQDYYEYKTVMLRSAGNESRKTRFRDALLASRARGLNVLYMEAVPTIVYVNGKFFGHYNLREKINKYSIAQFEGITNSDDIDNIIIIKNRGIVLQGDSSQWNQLISFCKRNNLNIPENLQWIEEHIDIDNLFTHTAIEMIAGNADIGNIRYYKVPGGKWKCALFDLDGAMGDLRNRPIGVYCQPVSAQNDLFYHEPFSALMQVPEMKERFLPIFAQVLMHYLPNDLIAQIDAWTAVLKPLMAKQLQKWPSASPASLGLWKDEINDFKSTCKKRPKVVIDLLCRVLNISNEQRLQYFSNVEKILSEQ